MKKLDKINKNIAMVHTDVGVYAISMNPIGGDISTLSVISVGW